MPYRYVFVLNACNLRCSFCFQEKPIKGSLQLNDWANIASQLPKALTLH